MVRSFNPEELYSFLQNRKWREFLDALHKHKAEIASNQVAQQATTYFIDEFLKNVRENEPELYLYEFDKIILLHFGKYFILPQDILKNIIGLKLKGLIKVDSLKAYKFAKEWNQYDFADNYCKEYEIKVPIKIQHSNEDEVNVTYNKDISDEDFTIPLFKSEREYNFFQAIKEYFPNYHTYPNVALSCVIDYNKISTELSPKQKEYFFKAIIDCVVYDSDDNYMPKYCFEIDSKYHDEGSAKIKDTWKDLFFSLAGHKLYRVRPINNDIGKKIFLEIIKEIFTQERA